MTTPPVQRNPFRQAQAQKLVDSAPLQRWIQAQIRAGLDQEAATEILRTYLHILETLHDSDVEATALLFDRCATLLTEHNVPISDVMAWNRTVERVLGGPAIGKCGGSRWCSILQLALEKLSHSLLLHQAQEPEDYDLSLISTFSYTKFYMSLLEWMSDIRTHVVNILQDTSTEAPYQQEYTCRFCTLVQRADMRFLISEDTMAEEFWEYHLQCHRLAGELFEALRSDDYLVALLGYRRMQDAFYAAIRKFSNFFVLYYENSRPRFQQFLTRQLSNEGQVGLMVVNVVDYEPIAALWGAEAGDHLLEHLEMRIDKLLHSCGDGKIVYIRTGSLFIIAFVGMSSDVFTPLREHIVDALATQEIRFRKTPIPFRLVSGSLILDAKLHNLPDELQTLWQYLAQRSAHTSANHVWIDPNDLGDFLKGLERHHCDREYLIEAFREELFTVFYQPIINAQTGHIEQVEILARIQDNGNHVSPGRYMDMIAGMGAMVNFDTLVLRRITQDFERLATRCPSLFVNVHPISLRSSEYITELRNFTAAAQRSQIRVLFEITEQSLLTSMDVVDYLHHHHHIRLALDDFGSGYSSMSMVVQMAERGLLEVVKFDGSLVMGMLSSNASSQAVSALQQMAHGLGLKTVAECVENDEVLERVRAMGIDYAQGFGIYRPLPLDQLLAIEAHHFSHRH